MFEFLDEFPGFPSSVRYGIISLAIGWLGVYYFFFRFFWVGHGEAPTRILIQLVGLGLLSCYFLMRIKKWARLICLTGNAVIILFFISMAWQFSNLQQPEYTTISILILLCFAVSTYFLAIGETSRFFKQYNETDASEAPTAAKPARRAATRKNVKKKPK